MTSDVSSCRPTPDIYFFTSVQLSDDTPISIENPIVARIRAEEYGESSLPPSRSSSSVFSARSRLSSVNGFDQSSDFGWQSISGTDLDLHGSSQHIKRRPRSLLRRGSSFGGAPIVVKTVPPPAAVFRKQASSNLRWIVLFLSCFLLFGNFYGKRSTYLRYACNAS
jgi:hypothetical protein